MIVYKIFFITPNSIVSINNEEEITKRNNILLSYKSFPSPSKKKNLSKRKERGNTGKKEGSFFKRANDQGSNNKIRKKMANSLLKKEKIKRKPVPPLRSFIHSPPLNKILPHSPRYLSQFSFYFFNLCSSPITFRGKSGI